METLARFIISAIELGEAEGRMLRRQIVRLVVTCAFVIITLLMIITGLSFLSWGLFRAIALVVGPIWSAMVLGIIWLGISYSMYKVVRARF